MSSTNKHDKLLQKGGFYLTSPACLPSVPGRYRYQPRCLVATHHTPSNLQSQLAMGTRMTPVLLLASDRNVPASAWETRPAPAGWRSPHLPFPSQHPAFINGPVRKASPSRPVVRGGCSTRLPIPPCRKPVPLPSLTSVRGCVPSPGPTTLAARLSRPIHAAPVRAGRAYRYDIPPVPPPASQRPAAGNIVKCWHSIGVAQPPTNDPLVSPTPREQEPSVTREPRLPLAAGEREV